MKKALIVLCILGAAALAQEKRELPLPTSKLLLTPVPGAPQRTNSFPSVMAVSPDGRYLALLHDGYGVAESQGQQSIAVLDLQTNQIADYPDPRLVPRARQTYFGGLAFSRDGGHLYASIASITDPLGEEPGSTGNGIAIYGFAHGRVLPERFIRIPLQQLAPGKKSNPVWNRLPEGQAVPYPAGLMVAPLVDEICRTKPGSDLSQAPACSADFSNDRLLVADNLSDDALLLDPNSGKVIHRYDLSASERVPAMYPHSVVVSRLGLGWVSLWNGSAIAELNLLQHAVTRTIKLRPPGSAIQAGSHPGAMLPGPNAAFLYVALSNRDEIAVVDLHSYKVKYFSTQLPDQKYPGSYPIALAQSADGRRLFVANASSDAIAVFDIRLAGGSGKKPLRFEGAKLKGFIPTEWYPSALTVHNGELFIASGKGRGTGPNASPLKPGDDARYFHPYIASLLHGSLARLKLDGLDQQLPALTQEVLRSNRMNGRTGKIAFARGGNPIKHVIYVIKENRTYDQVFGDLKPGNGDPSLVLYGEDITPNQHQLARQFGILDNFYDSGEVSGNGHVWSNAAITSDYTERAWQIGYRGRERTYDYEGVVANRVPLDDDIPDVNEPGTGYLWTNLARHHRRYRHYGEYVTSKWCNEVAAGPQPPQQGTPLVPGPACAHSFTEPDEPLADGKRSPYRWPIPILAGNHATKPELRDHFDPRFADFNLQYPDQLRADEFLREFGEFEQNGNLPEFITLRLPADHTAAKRERHPTPAAAVADNDLALGRVVEAVSHSSYWDSTAIFVLEDDAQNGADHVDAHRSIALVISKYSPSKREAPLVDHRFYTTVNVIHTMEALLGLPPMNNNDTHAALMAPLFSGAGDQPPFRAEWRNRDNGLIYQANPPGTPAAAQSAQLDFSHADSADTALLNRILWQDRKGDAPMPAPKHEVFPE